MSPLAGKRKKQNHPMKKSIVEKRRFIPGPPMLPSDIEAAQLTETKGDDDLGIAPIEVATTEVGEDESGDEYASESEEDDWAPPSALGNKTLKAKANVVSLLPEITNHVPKSLRKNAQVSNLAQRMDGLLLQAGGPDDSVVIVPVKQRRELVDVDDDEDKDGTEPRLPIVKKKKRY
jgi:kinesin family protein 20